MLATLELETGRPPTASVIWLHGLGADGHDFEPIVPELDLPDSLPVRFVFPHAPMQPVTINGGRVIRGGEEVVTGTVLEADVLARQLDQQRQRVDEALSTFAENTMAHVRQEGDLLTGRVEFPAIRTKFRDRHARLDRQGTHHVHGKLNATQKSHLPKPTLIR